jgi:predicted RND superfamily exporter protein
MAISISYGIAIATVLTLLMLPLLLSVVNDAKTKLKWLWTGEDIDREEVERVIKEMRAQEELDRKFAEMHDSPVEVPRPPKPREKKSTVIEEPSS